MSLTVQLLGREAVDFEMYRRVLRPALGGDPPPLGSEESTRFADQTNAGPFWHLRSIAGLVLIRGSMPDIVPRRAADYPEIDGLLEPDSPCHHLASVVEVLLQPARFGHWAAFAPVDLPRVVDGGEAVLGSLPRLLVELETVREALRPPAAAVKEYEDLLAGAPPFDHLRPFEELGLAELFPAGDPLTPARWGWFVLHVLGTQGVRNQLVLSFG